jgi:GTPase involved in cell partitioning and DNA repair
VPVRRPQSEAEGARGADARAQEGKQGAHEPSDGAAAHDAELELPLRSRAAPASTGPTGADPKQPARQAL